MAKKIMVVDDDPAIVEYLVSVFKDNGYETCSASDGEAALGVLEKEKPQLITLDLEMPNEWGPRFYRKYTQKDEYKDIPVIVISGLAGIHLAIRKAVATVNKPFDPQEVLKIVEQTIGKP
ncbi:response regulator [Desulfovibrio aminophilus]|nr:response regulator [Desulfovibrio aminophilus]MCM0756114.1 response regulator [Desulfovibrio aminophilus]